MKTGTEMALPAPMKDMAILADDLYTAKKAEDAAKAQRISVEEAIAALVETGDNGSKTVAASDHFKVTVKRALRYAADMDAIMQMKLPEGVAPLKVIPPQPEMLEFDSKAYEGLREKDPATFNQIAAHVTATPAKVSVSLKLA